LRAAADIAKQAVLAQKKVEVQAAGDELDEGLRSELAYLRSCPESEYRGLALRDREALLASVCSPSVVTDAVAIVIGFEGR
jgi:hypothetical protein